MKDAIFLILIFFKKTIKFQKGKDHFNVIMGDSPKAGTTWVNCSNFISTWNSLTTFGSLGFKVVSITLLFKN